MHGAWSLVLEIGSPFESQAASTADLLRFQKNKLCKVYAYIATVIILSSGFIPLHGESHRVFPWSTDLFCQSKDVDFCYWIEFSCYFHKHEFQSLPPSPPQSRRHPCRLSVSESFPAWVSKLAGRNLCIFWGNLLIFISSFSLRRKHSSSKEGWLFCPENGDESPRFQFRVRSWEESRDAHSSFSVIYFSFGKCGFWAFQEELTSASRFCRPQLGFQETGHLRCSFIIGQGLLTQ